MHPEALSDKGRVIFTLLKNFTDFYLGGGTALALQIGHRISVDFDLFSEKEILENLLGEVEKIFSQREIKPSVNNRDELTVFVDSIKTTFLRYPFPPILEIVSYEGVKLLSIKEIAATKAYTIGRRGSYKDYVDLYFILSEGHASLDETIELAERKYGTEINPRLFLEQLIYLGDVKDIEVLFLKKPTSKKEIESFFEEEVRKVKL